MTDHTLCITLFDYWHAGSGRGSGPVYDAEPVRSDAGLPYLPGRTVRGLLREGMALAEESALPEVPAGSTTRVFGHYQSPGQARQNAPGPQDPGLLRLSNATLGAQYEAWLSAAARADREALAQSLYAPLAATAIDRTTGQVNNQTLRVIEVALPLTLEATVTVLPSGEEAAKVRALLEAALPWIRGLGVSRRRGLGRCRFAFETPEEVSR